MLDVHHLAPGIGTGIGRRMTGEAEAHERKEILTDWLSRAAKARHIPGTHTLGKEFQTVEPKKATIPEPVSLT